MATATGIRHTIVVPTAREKVFEYLSNPASMKEWMPGGPWDVWITSPTPIKAGSEFRARRSGTLEEYEGTVKELQATDRIAFRMMRGSREAAWAFDLAAQSGGTEIRCTYDVHTHGVLRMTESFMRRGTGHHAHEALGKLQARFGGMTSTTRAA